MGFYNTVSFSPRFARIMPAQGTVRDPLEKEIGKSKK